MSGPVVVIGAGIAGLNAALRLHEASVETIVIEAGPHAGGRIETDRFDGFVVDYGPDSFLTTRPWALALATELGLRSGLQGTRPWRHRAFINRDGVLHAMPDGMSGLVPANAGSWRGARMLSRRGRLRAALGPRRRIEPAAGGSVAAFARYRFGDEAWDWLLEPLLAGIHGGDGDQLELASTFPGLVARPGEARPGGAPDPELGVFATPVNGMQTLTDALVGRLGGAELRLDTEVVRVERDRAMWRVVTNAGTVDAQAVILAVPASAAAVMLENTLAPLANRLGAIPFSPSVVVHAAWDESAVPTKLEGHGYLNPRAAGRPVAACTWISSKFEYRCPAGSVLLRAFIKPGVLDPLSLSDDEAWRHVAEELRAVLGISRSPAWRRIHRHVPGMPQYVVGHSSRIADIDRLTASLPGLFLTGNSYRGIGIPDTIRSSDHAAADALAFARRLAVPFA